VNALKDPLAHFLLIGAALFAVWFYLNPPVAESSGDIVVTAGDVEKMRQTVALVQGRPGTDDEVNAVIEAHIREEVLYREALAAGLDRDDTLVRNRLIEKIRFLTENVGEPPLPTVPELEAYFAQNAERFRIPATVTFEQVFFALESRGERARSDAAAALPRMNALRAPQTQEQLARLGDPLPLWNRYDAMTTRDVGLAFGDEFAAGLAQVEPGAWAGPVQSRFGWHLVRVVERAGERQPALAEIRDTVETAVMNERRVADNEARFRAMRERYDVVVEAAGAAPADAASGGTTDTSASR